MADPWLTPNLAACFQHRHDDLACFQHDDLACFQHDDYACFQHDDL